MGDILSLDRDGSETTVKRPYITYTQALDMQKLFLAGYVRIVWQHHNDVITVPPGWAHQVVNLKPCLKVAFDFASPSAMPVYAIVHKQVLSRLVGAANTPDYTAWIAGMEDVITEMMLDICCDKM